MNQRSLIWIALLLFPLTSLAEEVPFDSPRWEITPKTGKAVEYLGRSALKLQGGAATVKDSVFEDGVITFDIAFSGERNFAGAFWRKYDPNNFEEFYFRPHQSGKPDANQYTPIFNRVAGWQLYHGEGYGTPVVYDFNRWIPVKIVVSGNSAEVYIKDWSEPALFIPVLKHELKPGAVGLFAANFAPAYFSNFQYVSSKPVLKNQVKPPETLAKETVMQWQVSSIFDEKDLTGKQRLSSTEKNRHQWEKLACETSGLANFARIRVLGKDANTIFARITIQSGRAQSVPFHFGYSDRIKVFLNDRMLYSGDNGYQSRDFRHLGTIGFFDAVTLNLTKGNNELWLAVSENFGGWGLKGRFETMDGIQIVP